MKKGVKFLVTTCCIMTAAATAAVTAVANGEKTAEELNNAIINGEDISEYENVDLFAYSDAVKNQEKEEYNAEDHYGVNDSGLTYGSAAWATDIDDEPDLILAQATNGEIGYVYNDELDGETPASPEEAKNEPGYVINVYESDGQTVIGEFEVGEP